MRRADLLIACSTPGYIRLDNGPEFIAIASKELDQQSWRQDGVRRAAHSERLAAQGQVVALLHRRVESIHVDVDDLALPLLRLG